MQNIVSLNLKVDAYTRRVLGVIKEKYGLVDMGQALDKFAHAYGFEYVEEEANDDYIKKMLALQDDHFKRHGNKKMTEKELDALFKQ